MSHQRLIEQYVAGRLGEAEAEAFELACLKDPELARQVEFEQRLKAGLGQVASGSTAEFVRSATPAGWWLAAAAGVVLFVIAGGWLWKTFSGAGSPVLAAVTSASRLDAPSFRLAQVRGVDRMPRLPSGQVRLEIVGLFDLRGHYDVMLDRLAPEQASRVATLHGQRPATPTSLEVLLDADQLESGTYELQVSRNASDEENLEFTFEK